MAYSNWMKILFVVVVLAIVAIVITYFTTRRARLPKSNNVEHFESNEERKEGSDVKNQHLEGRIAGDDRMQKLNSDTQLLEERAASCFPKDQLRPDELLPSDTSSTWAQVNPEGQGSLKDKNFLQCGYHIGINTVGQTLRNSNLQLRSEPPCPQVQVSPWLQSTIEPDVNRKPFEIGGCA